jgi:hypothetical protein
VIKKEDIQEAFKRCKRYQFNLLITSRKYQKTIGSKISCAILIPGAMMIFVKDAMYRVDLGNGNSAKRRANLNYYLHSLKYRDGLI